MCHQHLTEQRQPKLEKLGLGYKIALFFGFLFTFPLGLGAFIIDLFRVLSTKENDTDESYFFIYVGEVSKYVKELVCSLFI